MSERFATDGPIEGDGATLSGPEAHHLLHVMRLGVGDRVTLVDGSGAEFLADVESATRRDVRLAIVERTEADRELPDDLVLGVALPKGDRQKVLVEKLTELGVTRLVPLATERSVAVAGEGALDKLRRAVIEASKQCRRNRWMRVEPPRPLGAFLDDPLGDGSAPLRLIAHPQVTPLGPLASCVPAAVAIGPEGGFTDAEVDAAAAAGWRAVSLGPRVLRVETAAIALAAILGGATPPRGG
ncbi:MAG: RsmE family RNA methyltransferase [Lacipirellulaceae bacterium]